jgi:DNA replication protein DnaC
MTLPTWRPAFDRRCEALGLGLYCEQLEQLQSGALVANDLYLDFQARWRAVEPGPGITRAALLMGGEGAGKSLCAMWAAAEKARVGGTWEFTEPGLIARLWARKDWGAFRELEVADLVIFDEIGDSPDLNAPAWIQLKTLINYRYRARRDFIIIAIPGEQQLREAVLGNEIVDRIPPDLRIDAGTGSWRHGGGVSHVF